MKIFKITNYFLTPRDLAQITKRFYHWSHYTDALGLIIIASTAFTLSYLLLLPPEPIFFICFIIATIYWHLDSRVSITLALICLITIPILLTLYNKNILFYGDAWAETVAVWAYYFLVIGVVRQIFEYRGEGKGELVENNNKKEKTKNESAKGRAPRPLTALRGDKGERMVKKGKVKSVEAIVSGREKVNDIKRRMKKKVN